VARGKLGETGLENLQVIFRQELKVAGGNHFGSRPSPLMASSSSRLASASRSSAPRTCLTTSARSCVSIPMDRSRRTIPLSAVREPVPRSGPTGTAMRKAPPSTLRPVNFGRMNSARWAGMSSTFPRPAKITVGR
jgi:hypothetical protein